MRAGTVPYHLFDGKEAGVLRTRVRRRWCVGIPALLVSAVLALTACTADPPPPIEQAEPTTPPAPARPRSTVVVAIDRVDTGFNPHLLADQSPVANAVAGLVLPSAFRAVPDPENPAGSLWVPDETVLISAEVTEQAPFTITYQVRDEAQWSDSAPIAAEDFRYLWQQMITQPGVVDPAGYRLVDDVRSSGGGKTVTVTLREPYPAWRELFTHLLPAHLVKDTPGGFLSGLSETIPVSGGRFHVETVDRGRGEVLLERNDRFWGTPAVPDEILMRRGGSDSQLTESLRSGDAQVAEARGGTALLAQLDAVPGVRTGIQLQPRTLDLTLNTRARELADPRVRRGILALLDPELLALVGAGTQTGVVPARAQVLAPSDPGYAPTMPPRPSREEALGLLAEAGYVPVAPEPAPEEPSAPTGESATTPSQAPSTPPAAAPEADDDLLLRNGEPLNFVVGVPEDAEISLSVARTAADVLRDAGIAASVVELPPDELYGESLVDGDVHAILGWMRAGDDPATAALSRFGCPPVLPTVEGAARSTDPTADAQPDESPDAGGEESTTPASPTSQDEDADEREDEIRAALEAPSNLSGACDPVLEEDLLAAVRGTADSREVIAAAQPALWALAVNLPILQDRTVVAAGPDIDNVSLTGAVPAGIVGDAHLWWRSKP